MSRKYRSGWILGSRLTIAVALTIFSSAIANAGVLLSEFRTRGPNGGADEFVELYNNSDNPVDISGWKINASNSVGTTGTRVTIFAGTTIPARGHFLAINSTPGGGYSGSVGGNQTYTTGIADDGGIALLMADNTIVDQVGMSTGSAYKEGTFLAPLTANADQSYERKAGGGLGSTQDSNNNASDFRLRSINSNPQNLGSAATPPSAILQVTDCGDTGGANQLRQKVSDAAAMGGANIVFTCGPNVVLDPARNFIVISSNVFIDGANNITISGSNSTLIFGVTSTTTLVLKNISITHGFQMNPTTDGGAVINYGILDVENSHFLFNSTTSDHSGSAIYSQGYLILNQSEFANNTGGGGAVKSDFSSASTTATGCSFHDNQSDASTGGGYGGGMQIRNAAYVEVHNSTFTNNSAAAKGGAIFATPDATLDLDQVTFTGNSAPASGGAVESSGIVNVTACHFINNIANFGGAISLNSDGSNTAATLNIVASTFTSNGSAVQSRGFNGSGGAIYNNGGATVTECTFTANYAHDGGALAMNHQSAVLTLSESTLNGNIAQSIDALTGQGGGIFNGGQLAATNVTFSGNTAKTNGGAIGDFGTSTIVNCTFSGNSAIAGGGILASGGPHTIKNTVIEKSTGGNCNGVSGASFSLSDDNTCGFGSGRDNVNNILLDPLANNGGLTQTHLPQTGSAAIDAGTPSGAPSRDQREFSRAGAGLAVDVGAVEVGGTLLPAPTGVASLKHHGGTDFGIDLPLTGNGAIECRTGGATGAHQIVLNFANPVNLSGASVTKGIGTVSSYSVSGSQVIINLTGVANAQSIFTTLFDVFDGTQSNDITVPIGFLIGDTNADKFVDAVDVAQTKSKSGQAVNATNFREDVNADGFLDAVDVAFVKSKSGTVLTTPTLPPLEKPAQHPPTRRPPERDFSKIDSSGVRR